MRTSGTVLPGGGEPLTPPRSRRPRTSPPLGATFLARFTSPVALARIVLAIGIVTVLSAASPAIHGRVALLTQFLPGAFPAAATAGALVVGTLMIVVSRAVRRGKRRAWLMCVLLAGATIVLDLVKGLDVEEASTAALLLALLLAGRARFTARPDPRSNGRVAAVVLLGPLVATFLGWVWLSLDVRGEVAGTTAPDRIASAFTGLIGIPGPVMFSTVEAQADASIGLVVLGAGVLLALVLALVRPADGPRPLSAEDDLTVRGLVNLWGSQDSLSYFATRADRSLKLSPNARAGITYRVVGTVSLAGGDPIGDPYDWSEAIDAWLVECLEFGWTPAVLGASEAGAEAFGRAGLDALELGDEAILYPGRFTLDGREMRGIRQAVARCERAGITAKCHRLHELGTEERAEIAGHVVRWRDGGTERGFSMALGRYAGPADPDAVVVLARDADGRLHGVLSLVPWGTEGLSLDLMRRDRDSVNGLVELMVTELCRAAPDLGVTRISLNFAVFRAVFARGDRVGAGPVLRLWCGALRMMSRYWQLESLYRSNAKYKPDWVPRFVCFRRATDLPRIGLAGLRAEGFLTVPTWSG